MPERQYDFHLNGLQFAAIARDVPAISKPDLLHATLLAQLAADKQLQSGTDWHSTYERTLGKVFWHIQRNQYASDALEEGERVTLRQLFCKALDQLPDTTINEARVLLDGLETLLDDPVLGRCARKVQPDRPGEHLIILELLRATSLSTVHQVQVQLKASGLLPDVHLFDHSFSHAQVREAPSFRISSCTVMTQYQNVRKDIDRKVQPYLADYTHAVTAAQIAHRQPATCPVP